MDDAHGNGLEIELVNADNTAEEPNYTWLYRLRLHRVAALSEGFTEAEIGTMGAHVEYLEGLTLEGTVLLAGRTDTQDEHTFGIVVFVAESEAEAREIMAADPAVRDCLMAAELFPFRLAFLGKNEVPIL
jgi:uncharacterized protein